MLIGRCVNIYESYPQKQPAFREDLEISISHCKVLLSIKKLVNISDSESNLLALLRIKMKAKMCKAIIKTLQSNGTSNKNSDSFGNIFILNE